MVRQKNPNELYWNSVAKKQLREDYNQFLKLDGQIGSPDSANIFAMKKHAEGYRDMSIRELILFLEGELPYMFD